MAIARCLYCHQEIELLDDAEWTPIHSARPDGLPRSVHTRCMETVVREKATRVEARVQQQIDEPDAG